MFAVTFDLWHTLITLPPAIEDRYIERQEAALSEIVESSDPIADLGHAPGMEPREAAHRAFSFAMARKGRGSPVADLATDAARYAGRRPDTKRWIQAVESLVAEQPFEAVPGAREQLRRVVSQGYRTAVVSNLVGETGRSMRGVLERLDMARSVESWALSEELPWSKPAPEIFWNALEPLETAPRDAVHIGDLASDVHGARAAGFRCAILFQGAREYGTRYASLCRTDDPINPAPARVLASWEKLPSLLEVLFPERSRS